MIITDPASLQKVVPQDRVLLLPHCLRPSQRCTAHYNRDEGLLCKSCEEHCPINKLKSAAMERGFGGVCIAPGGSLALRYVKRHQPHGIVAVACDKELLMGIQTIASLHDNGSRTHDVVILTVSLCRDGCVDTEVDQRAVLEIINL